MSFCSSRKSSAKSHLQAVTCFGFLLRIQLSMRSTWTLSFVLKSLRKEIIKEAREKNHRNGSTDTVVGKKRKLICGGGMVRPAEAISDTLLHIAQTPIKRNERRARDPYTNTYTPAYQKQACCHVPPILQIGFTWQKSTEKWKSLFQTKLKICLDRWQHFWLLLETVNKIETLGIIL